MLMKDEVVRHAETLLTDVRWTAASKSVSNISAQVKCITANGSKTTGKFFVFAVESTVYHHLFPQASGLAQLSSQGSEGRLPESQRGTSSIVRWLIGTGY